MTRQEANFQILNMLGTIIGKYPDIRFGQALVNLDIIQLARLSNGDMVAKDPFYEESEVTCQRCHSVYGNKQK